jgi:hypothetical protein
MITINDAFIRILNDRAHPGRRPLRPCNGMTVVAEAEIRRHWLAAEITRAWIRPTGVRPGQ